MNFTNVLVLIGGVAIGATSTYFYMKDKCDKMVEEETYNIKKYYEEKYASEADKIEEKEEVKGKVDISEEGDITFTPNKKEEEPNYEEIIQKLNYNEFSTRTANNQKAKRPYIISQEEYNEDNGYIKKLISFFEDDEVCMDNETKEVLDNVAKDIGQDCIEQINMDGNEIFVRNEMLGIDYDILSETGSYEDFTNFGDT